MLLLAQDIGNDDKLSVAELDSFRQCLEHLIHSLHGKANMTASEVRPWRNENLVKAPERVVPKHTDIVRGYTTEACRLCPWGESYPPTIIILRMCSKALQTNNTEHFSSQSEYDPINEETEPENLSPLSHATFELACNVRTATLGWLDALNGSGGEPNMQRNSLKTF